MYVAEQAGTIEVFAADGASQGVLLDIRSQVSRAGNEEGFLGVAFAPGYPGAPYVFAYYSVAGGERRTRLSRFEVERDRVLAGSELVLLEQSQPFSNHKGGALRFGPDGMLYLGLGDGGSQGDPDNRAQNLSQWLGKVLRLDVRSSRVGRVYDVPPDNPFVARAGAKPEVWAYGFRNPWRLSFDAVTGALWVADVGQNNAEEVDVVEHGANLGWRRFEANDCYRGPCDDRSGLTFPVATYTHAEGCSVTGGVVYRGRAVPALVGWYMYSDYCSGRVWAVPASGGAPVALLGAGGARSVTSFGTDEAGEVYVAVQGGAVLRVVGAG
jgi:glucose/arabinose dehydrogenase